MVKALPLDGIRVIEFSHMIMGPSCGMILAELGADVVKVEPGPDGDSTRRLAGSGAGFFVTYNRNKRSVILDLKSDDGHRAALDLIASADVLIENFRPGALEKLGFGPAPMMASNGRLIYCSLKGFLAGPYEHRAALDEVVQMMGGLAYMTGLSGRPLRAGASVNDVMGGMFGAIGILAALAERTRTGRGQLVRSALFENNAFLVAQHMTQLAVTGKPAAPLAERISAWAVYELFATSDGRQIFVGVVTDTQWKAFCAAFGLHDLGDDPELRTNYDRVNRRAKFISRVIDLFAGMTLAEALAKCEAVGLPFAPVAKPEELFDDPHLNHAGGMVEVTIPGGARTRVVALPVELDGQRLALRRDIPLAGQHSEEVLRELGYGAARVASMAASGALTTERAPLAR
jgi:crotonobetainyl-CoA:carnitine CoA-transferase CaiB-like acyl-CoA transferase